MVCIRLVSGDSGFSVAAPGCLAYTPAPRQSRPSQHSQYALAFLALSGMKQCSHTTDSVTHLAHVPPYFRRANALDRSFLCASMSPHGSVCRRK